MVMMVKTCQSLSPIRNPECDTWRGIKGGQIVKVIEEREMKYFSSIWHLDDVLEMFNKDCEEGY